MPIDHIIALIRAERDRLDKALQALEGGTTRPTRPSKTDADANMPDWVKPPVKKTAPTTNKRKPMSAAQRKAQGQRMKAYWAAKKKAAK